MSAPVIVAEIAKNSAETVKIALDEFKGKRLVDVRIYCVFGDSETERPTKKGISLRIELLREFIEGLEAAEAEARRQGLIG